MIKQLKQENKKEIILGMDHNLDLLKSMIHKDTQVFLDLNFNENLLPCITCPTHITKTMATLIDNVFISQNLHKSFDSCVLVHDISDHMPSLVNIHGQKHDNNESLEFTCRSLNHDNIRQINNLLLMTDWSNLHKSDVNIAFSELQNRIDNCINAVASVKHVTISNHNIWREPWITKGLSKFMDKCAQLYKLSIKNNSSQICTAKYKPYRTLSDKN